MTPRSLSAPFRRVKAALLLSPALAALACGSEGPPLRPVDSVPPTITIVQPANDVQLATDQPLFVVRLSDDGTGIFPGTINATIDGQDFSQPFLNGYEGHTGEIRSVGQIRLPGGPHELVFRVQDQAGNAATARTSFTISLDGGGGGAL